MKRTKAEQEAINRIAKDVAKALIKEMIVALKELLKEMNNDGKE